VAALIVIRAAQMDAFSADLYRRFRAQLAERIAAERCGNARAAHQIAGAVDAALERAIRLGIAGTPELRRFGELLAALGTEFDTDERTQWAGALLRCRELPAATRLALIEARLARAAAGRDEEPAWIR
jgi:hypothetical protein